LPDGEAEGRLASRKAGGIKFGRAVKPGNEAGRFSVDVVRMKNVAGAHHVYAAGESPPYPPPQTGRGREGAPGGAPQFDWRPEGSYVYPPGSSHRPTVTGGDTCVYPLPDCAIEIHGQIRVISHGR
jgi:hypothetical protein